MAPQLPTYRRVGDCAPQLLQIPDEVAVGLHIGMLDQLGQVFLTHTWGTATGSDERPVRSYVRSIKRDPYSWEDSRTQKLLVFKESGIVCGYPYCYL